MSTRDADVVVIGSGPNGLVAACTLAKQGFQVLVLESNPKRAGGALGSEQATRPGFVHDVGAAFFPYGKTSPAFQYLGLEQHVSFAHALYESCHPGSDDSFACISREARPDPKLFGSERDGLRWQRVVDWYRAAEPKLLNALLGPLPSIGPILGLGVESLVRFASIALRSGSALSKSWFQSDAARRVLPGLALHVDIAPDDTFGAPLGAMLGFGATSGGYAVPVGGAQNMSDALVRILEAHGGAVRLGTRVCEVIVREGRACAVRTDAGEEIRATRAVLADTAAPRLLLDLVQRSHVPSGLIRKMERFPFGFGTFKVDWALSGPVPWRVPQARQSAVVHAGDNLEDLRRFAREVRQGNLPENPYLVIGQQSLVDPSRAPAGSQTLWAYSRVPIHWQGSWAAQRESFADRIDARIEGLAPGFKNLIVERRIVTPLDLEAMDANLVSGDLGGGSNAWNRMLVFRPAFPYFRYRMPVRGLYLCSSYAHPGAGVHGMCGFNAARVASRDLA